MWLQTVKFIVKKSKCAALAQEIGFSAPNSCSLSWLVKGATQLCTSKKDPCKSLQLYINLDHVSSHFFSSSLGIHLLILQSSYLVHVLMRKVFHLIGSPLLRCVHEGLKAGMIKLYWLSSKLAHIVFLYCTHNILNMLWLSYEQFEIKWLMWFGCKFQHKYLKLRILSLEPRIWPKAKHNF